ncbi:hypothetical protein PN480_12220 [Dolichospermum circinale CS-1225]|uniref:hypothetical protein n=1 Tax=Dolichospermum circinale TaxID=109265 RepID=UPI00040D715E|nr:hypothetical protein [Dolichospermum circinale]MDB9467698.1 hypothetical protein [Dolichospermum circinale CS-539/09]MDB9471251.1 hypothetical protein [Dolichospermum circinale CS-539]MDB9522707.1 hypothetical protein [Dolichospermum circinale CS-1225]
MKCINCGTDNKLKDRTANQGRCLKCNHPFVFEPTSMGTVKITDSMFSKTLADISASYTLYFTPKQLLYFLDSRVRKKAFQPIGFWSLYLFLNVWVTGFGGGVTAAFIPNSFLVVNLVYQAGTILYLFNNTNSSRLNNASRKASAKTLQRLGVLILVVGISASLFVLDSFPVFSIVVILGLLSIFLGTRQLGKVQNLPQELLFSSTDLDSCLRKWQQINGKVDQVLTSQQEQIAPKSINPDITAYSFDRLVVCDSANMAQLLIANNFHFENNCAILSITGYPQSIFSTTMEMLRRNPDLKVYAIHDCSPKGVSLVHHLRTSEKWFLNSNVTIIDLGLLPRQIIASQGKMFIRFSSHLKDEAKKLSVDIRQSLTAEELAWLDTGNFVELESFTPQKLIQVLRHGISGSLNLESDDSSIILIGDSGINSGNDIYMVESFG